MDTMTRNEITYLWAHAFDRRMRHAISTEMVFVPGDKITIMYSSGGTSNWYGNIFSSMVIL